MRGELDVTELASWLGHLVLLQVEERGRDFLHRVYGTVLAEYFGRDLTGRRVSSLRPDIRRVVHAEYGEVIAYAQPCAVVRRRSVNSTRQWLTKLILPLGPDAERVDHLLVGAYLAE